MGSFGALYYATVLEPSAVIIGKPLINIGTIANNMKLLRPNEFGTANDVLLANEGFQNKILLTWINVLE